MIQLSNIRLAALLCFILSIGVITSCKKNNDEAASGKIELLSFGPTGARHGDTLRFIGQNLNKVTAIQLTGALVAQSGFKQQTAELILIIVPPATEKGYVTLKTPEGDIVSKTQLNLEVVSTVTSMTPQARPGQNITINGAYLNWVTRITFANGKNVGTFVSKSINQLVVTVPLDAQTGPLIISYGGTDSMAVQTTDTLKVTLPSITTMSPNPAKHQTNLTITGADLDLAKQVIFNGEPMPVTSFVSQSATQLVVKVPATAKTGKLTLVAASGVSVTSAVDAQILFPAIVTLAPNPVDPLTNLTITGTSLDLVTAVSFTGVAAPVTTFVSQSPTQLVVVVPSGTLKGKVILSVLNSTLVAESGQVLDINGGLPPLAAFAFTIYDDVLQNTFQDWSYTDTHDFNSTAIVRQGAKSIKAIYNAGNGYQALTFHAGTGAPTTGYTKLEFSVFGEPGTGGKKLNVVINGNYTAPPQVTIVEGAWTTYNMLFSALGNPATLNEVVLQSAGWGGVIHVDHVGFR